MNVILKTVILCLVSILPFAGEHDPFLGQQFEKEKVGQSQRRRYAQ